MASTNSRETSGAAPVEPPCPPEALDDLPSGESTLAPAVAVFPERARVKLYPMNPANAPDRGAALRQVRHVIERLVRDGSAVARSDGTLHSIFPVAASAAEGEALRDWVTRERATNTIEIGLGYGVSALFVCEGLLANGRAGTSHVVLDPYQVTRFADCGLQFLEEAGLGQLAGGVPRGRVADRSSPVPK